MPQLPVGYQAKGILSGFPALYAIFTIGCIVLCVLAIVILPNIWIRHILVIIFGTGFIALIVYAIIRERSHPETFSTKQTLEYSITITQQQIKSPQEKRPKIIGEKRIPLPPSNQTSVLKP